MRDVHKLLVPICAAFAMFVSSDGVRADSVVALLPQVSERAGAFAAPTSVEVQVMGLSGGITPRPGDPASLGFGFNSITGQFMNSCIVPTPVEQVTTAQQVQFEIRQIESVRELSRELGFSASASARFGLGSASASFAYAGASDVNSFSSTFMVRSRVENGTQFLREPDLTRAAARMLRTQGPQRFAESCGDEFVRSLVSGGEFIALITVDSRSARDREQIRATFQGSYLGVGGGTADFGMRMSRIATDHNVQSRIIINGSTGRTPPVVPGALIEYAQGYPEMIRASATPWLLRTASYRLLTTIQREPLSYVAQNALLEGLSLRLDRAIELRNDMLYVQNHPAQFCSPDLPAIGASIAALEAYIVEIGRHAQRCTGSSIPTIAQSCTAFDRAVPAAVPVVHRPEAMDGGTLRDFPVDMTAPVQIPLNPDEVCSVVRTTGTWAAWETDPQVRPCPGLAVGNNVAEAGFDSHYHDNRGQCNYTFRCFPRSAVYACPSGG